MGVLDLNKRLRKSEDAIAMATFLERLQTSDFRLQTRLPSRQLHASTPFNLIRRSRYKLKNLSYLRGRDSLQELLWLSLISSNGPQLGLNAYSAKRSAQVRSKQMGSDHGILVDRLGNLRS